MVDASQAECHRIYDLIQQRSQPSTVMHMIPFAYFVHQTTNSSKQVREILRAYHVRLKVGLHPKMIMPFVSITENTTYFMSSAEPADFGHIKYVSGTASQYFSKGGNSNLFDMLPEGMEPTHRAVCLDHLSQMDAPYLGVKKNRVIRLPNSKVYLRAEMVNIFGSTLHNGLLFATCLEPSSTQVYSMIFESGQQMVGASKALLELDPELTMHLGRRQLTSICPTLAELLGARSKPLARGKSNQGANSSSSRRGLESAVTLVGSPERQHFSVLTGKPKLFAKDPREAKPVREAIQPFREDSERNSLPLTLHVSPALTVECHLKDITISEIRMKAGTAEDATAVVFEAGSLLSQMLSRDGHFLLENKYARI